MLKNDGCQNCGCTFNIEPRALLTCRSHLSFGNLMFSAAYTCVFSVLLYKSNLNVPLNHLFREILRGQTAMIQQRRILKRQSRRLFRYSPFKKLQSLYHDVVHSMFSIKDSDNYQILNLTYYVCVATTGFKTLFDSIPGNLEIDLGLDSSLESSQSISSNITSK